MSNAHAVRPNTGSARRAPRRGGRSRSSGWWPLLFVGPFLLGIAVFYYYPIAQTIYYSFTTWGVFGGSSFSGLHNYRTLFSDPALPAALLHTLIYIGIVLTGIPIATWLASLLNRPGLRGVKIFRITFLLPYVAMPVAIAMVWRFMFNGDYGLINYLLSRVGISGPQWLVTPGVALVAVSLVGLWASIGFNVIILSAGMKNIPTELYDAAALDGASTFRQFRSITVPLLTPWTFLLVVTNVIAGFQVFDLIFVLIGSTNPVIAQTQTLMYLFYNESFVQNDKGYGAAIAIVTLFVIAIATALQFRLQRRWVTYA